MEKNIYTFIGCDKSYEESNIVLFGAPFDGTTSYRPGTRFGPQAVRIESHGIEMYSPYQDKDLQDINVFDSGDLEFPFGNVEKVINLIEERTTKILSDGKIPIMIGGEHLVSLGSIKAVAKKYSDVHIIHFDAHADLRDEYLGERLSHASVVRRAWDIVGDGRIFQFGIRSGCREEFCWSKDRVFTNKYNFNGLDYLIENIGNKPVYLTIDLDIVDPSHFPGTGTPEAGGVTFMQLLEACFTVMNANVVAVDINELSPVYDQSGCSTAFACKLLREILLSIK